MTLTTPTTTPNSAFPCFLIHSRLLFFQFIFLTGLNGMLVQFLAVPEQPRHAKKTKTSAGGHVQTIRRQLITHVTKHVHQNAVGYGKHPLAQQPQRIGLKQVRRL